MQGPGFMLCPRREEACRAHVCFSCIAWSPQGGSRAWGQVHDGAAARGDAQPRGCDGAQRAGGAAAAGRAGAACPGRADWGLRVTPQPCGWGPNTPPHPFPSTGWDETETPFYDFFACFCFDFGNIFGFCGDFCFVLILENLCLFCVFFASCSSRVLVAFPPPLPVHPWAQEADRRLRAAALDAQEDALRLRSLLDGLAAALELKSR